MVFRKELKMTPLKAIRKNCIECMGGSISSVKSCDITDCPLHKYRFGKNPNRKGIGGNKKLIKKKELL